MPATASSPAPAAADLSTKERILDAAEELFALEGFEKVSLRGITGAADVNLASVNYHFGSKDALIDAVMTRSVAPLNRERLERLEALEQEHEGAPVPVRDVLYAFLRPVVSLIQSSKLSEQLFVRLMGRCMSEPDYRLPPESLPGFEEMIARFSGAIGRSLPELSPQTIMWRLFFTFGTLAQSLMHVESFKQVSGGRAGDPSLEEMLGRIIDYTAAGFAAPETSPGT